MQPIVNFLVYCCLVAVVLYIVWQCVFEPIRRSREEKVRTFTRLNEVDIETGDIQLEEERLQDTKVDLDSDEIDELI
tara:strand:+ start:2820 stop:3050 length:231 start_codon:yes stop_codon:yes gene_type:complete